MNDVTIDQAMEIARTHHRAGRLAEAEAIYRQVLDRFPDHPGALHLLGVLAYQTGHNGPAIDLIARAIALKPAVPEYHLDLGNALKHHASLDRAIAAYHRAIQLAPGYAAAHSNLGGALCEQGRLDEAIGAYHQAIALKPDLADAHNNLGNALKDQGRLDEAIAAYRRAIALAPGLAGAHSNLANALKDQGRRDEAIDVYRRAIQLSPGSAQAYNNLGCALGEQGRLDEAIDACRRAIALAPGLAEAHGNLGNALRDQGQLDEAIAAYRSAIALAPDLAESHSNLGNALRDQGRLDEAIDAYRRAIQLSPGSAQAHNNLGCALRAQGRLDEAIAACRRAIALKPGLAEAHGNLGNALRDQGQLDEAIAAYHRAIALAPKLAESHSNLGNALRDQGRLDEAIDAYQRAIRLGPGLATARSNLLFALHYHPDHDAPSILRAHRQWARDHAAPLAGQIRPHPNTRAPARRLRIGYVSPDFRDHPVGRLLLPLFSHHDRQHTEVIGYSDVRTGDAVTAQLRTLADGWHHAVGRSDPQLAELIRADRIDILVDLALHTGGNRILVFARKPAPVQVTMLGMPATTGLDTMDYRLTDPYLDPPGSSDADYTEQSIRLPHCYWCYQPPVEAPPAGALPARENGFATFGCLNHPAKVNRQVLQLWSKILLSLPGSRLVLHSPPGSHRDAIRALFQQDGIAPDRIEFAGSVAFRTYLERYHNLDLCLDPFPYNGGVTTMDALWMGVPVITLAGRTAVGRGGVSILSNAGLPGLIARTPEEYVAIAVEWARDGERLAALRAGLRARMLASPLMDGKQYAADVEAAFRGMWQAWCMTEIQGGFFK